MLNRSAARLAMSVFQRRLASSTLALLRSFERRIDKLTALIGQIQDGTLTIEQLITLQRRIRKEEDVLESTTAEDEAAEGDREQNEVAEERLLEGVVAASLVDLQAELEQVKGLRDLTQRIYDAGPESKFERLREVLIDPRFSGEKLIIFTEHWDTLDFLVRRLDGMGYTGQVAQIHGGMYYTERDEQVEKFRKPAEQGGARFLVCTDAAGEGINLQFCWIMINYDVPWNPARLEQRMGRIHRYGQKHDPVIILNLVAPKTREGRVLQTLLDKLERIRKELRSDKVFDVIGRLFEGVSIKQYMEMAVEGRAEEAAVDLNGRLTKEQVEALIARERTLYDTGGDVARELPRLRDDLDRETYRRLLTCVVFDTANGKQYRIPTAHEIEAEPSAGEQVPRTFADIPFGVPSEPIPRGASRVGGGSAFSAQPYGLAEWSHLFNRRQLLALGSFVNTTRSARVECEHEGYTRDWIEAISAMLALAVDRLADRGSTICSWAVGWDKIRNTFTRFALPITWD